MPIVVGTDGIVPIYNPEALWAVRSIDQTYLGQEGSGKHVPNVNDYIVRPSTFEVWIVDHIDPLTLIPTLRSIKPAGMNTDLTEEDILFGIGPGPCLDTYRAFLNDATTPYTLSLDQRWMPKGTMSSYCKIFKGTDTSAETGEVISKVYDASGNFVSTAVPLELAAIDSHTNYSCKIVQRCNCTQKLVNGERVTAVIYSDDGVVVERRQFLVENTDTISDVGAATKYITEIGLESIWLSPTSPDVLEYPLNIPMDALNLVGVVLYSDGTEARYPVNGTKFSMFGLEGRVATTMEPPSDLVLSYQMSSSEIAFASTGVNGRQITKPYKLKIVNTNESISVKLFGYPFWESGSFGYRMKWFMLNMGRNTYFDVTNHVKFNTNTGAYDPKLYGYLQRKSVSINLRDVSPSYIPFIHTQSVDIILNNAAQNSPAPDWKVRTVSSDSNPGFGNRVWAKKVGGNQINLTAEHSTFADWLDAYYYQTLPLYNAAVENAPPAPTHFEVSYGTTKTIWPIESWDDNIAVASSVAAKATVLIRFIKRTASGDLSLSFAAALIKSY